jgi:hypothetical protein
LVMIKVDYKNGAFNDAALGVIGMIGGIIF